MSDLEKHKLCKEAKILLERIEKNMVYIVESIEAKRLKKAA